jgi:hypothetical protein
MQNVGRLVAILSLVGLFALDWQAVWGQEEGGFQVPLNADPVIPVPSGLTPSLYPAFQLRSEALPRRLALPSLRKPKPGERLGEYLIASELPPRYLVTQPTLPTITMPEPLRTGQCIITGSVCGGDPPVPKLGELPSKPGECIGEYVGEYAIASELPPRYPVTQPNLPTMPGYQIEIGYRFSDPSTAIAPTPTVTLLPPVPVAFMWRWYDFDR